MLQRCAYKVFFGILVVLQIFSSIPSVAMEEPIPVYEDRYLHEYAKDFFLTGGEPVPFNSFLHLKIGIVLKNKSQMAIREIINVVFSAPPYDRYRNFFVFIDERTLEKNKSLKNFFIEAFDGNGRKIPGGYDVSNSSVRAGLVVLEVDDYEFTRTGTLGYARGTRAIAQKMTVLHELSHVLAGLADEYSMQLDGIRNEDEGRIMKKVGLNYKNRQHRVWNTEKTNIDYRSHKYLKWQPLIDKGIIADERVNRVIVDAGEDVGRFVVPTRQCIMNRLIDSDIQFCPVCQLEIIEAICRLTGARPPWE